MTFLFENEKLLDQLVDTIDNTVNDNGYFVGTVMDGYRTIEYLNRNRGIVNTDCFTIKALSQLKANTFGNQIEINLKGTETATTQIEYLVYLDILESKLRDRNISLIKSVYCDDSSINDILKDYKLEEMTSLERELNRLYRFFVFKRTLPVKEISDKILIINPENPKYIIDDRLQSNTDKLVLYTHVNFKSDSYVESEDNFVKVGAIGTDNNCFFHSLLITTDFKNYNDLSYKARIDCARQIREDIVKSITPFIFENINYGMISYSRTIKLFYQNLVSLVNNKIIIWNNQQEREILQSDIKYLLFKKYPLMTNFTNRVAFVTESLIKSYENSDELYKSELRTAVFNAGVKAKKETYQNYINELLDRDEERFVKYIDNEDIQMISAVIGRQIILVSNKTNAPISYTSFSPN